MPAARFHHVRDLEHAAYDVVLAHGAADLAGAPCARTGRCDWDDDWHWQRWWDSSYAWLAVRVGFWPLFLAVDELWCRNQPTRRELIRRGFDPARPGAPARVGYDW